MTGIRNNIGSAQFSTIISFTNLILYLALVVYTVLFTIHYLKRVAYLAFFTMIAPLIALTYPIDKIKDGQAQAFGMWFKEYIFNALLPVIHVVIYTIFVGTASEFALSNPLYAIVCIGFLLTAEKFFKKMFGFDKATTTGQLGAAAGGALVMNAINKMGQRSGKQAADSSEGGKSSLNRLSSANSLTVGIGSGGANPASAGANPASAGANPTPAGANPTPIGANPAPAGANPAPAGANPAPAGANPTPIGANLAPTSLGSSAFDVEGNFGTTRKANRFGPTMLNAIKQPRRIRNGVSAIGRNYVNANTAKKVGKMARRGLIGAVGGAALGTFGLAAGVATGDFSNAVKYAGVGALAGYMGANSVGDKVLSGSSNIKELLKEGALGQNEYNNLKADKEFYNSKEFRSMVNNKDLLTDKTGRGRTAAMRNAVQTYRDNGITDTNKIAEAMKKGLTPEEGAYAIKLADMIGRSGWNNPTTRKDFETRYKSKIPGANGDKIWNSIEDLL